MVKVEHGVDQLSELERVLNLEQQYKEQVSYLWEWGFLQVIPEQGSLGFVDIKGDVHLVPSYYEVRDRVLANAAMLKEKIAQGFTTLLMVPFGAPLVTFLEYYEILLKKQAREGTLKKLNEQPFTLNFTEPVSFRYPLVDGLDQNVAENDSYTKDNFLGGDVTRHFQYIAPTAPNKPSQPFGDGADIGLTTATKFVLLESEEVWQLALVEPDLEINSKSVGKASRRPLRDGYSFLDHHESLQKRSDLQYEEGLTLESWIILVMTQLQRHGVHMDSYDDSVEEYMTMLLGFYSKDTLGSDAYCVRVRSNKISFIQTSLENGVHGLYARTLVKIPSLITQENKD